MSAAQAIFFAFVQGVTELFPVSSLGHAVVMPAVLGWAMDEKAPDFLPFLVALHLGTSAALLLYFRRDWFDFLGALFHVGPKAGDPAERRLFWLVAAATVPAAAVGFAFEKWFRLLFGTPPAAAAFLIVNGVVLFAGERLRRRGGGKALAELKWLEAVAIGVSQCAALIPGISRSGATIVAGLATGLRHAEAARFSFLMATPIILGAGVLELPKLLHQQGGLANLGGLAAVAGIVAGVTAYASVSLLMRYFKRQDFEALDPFAYYCVAAGTLALAYLVYTA